MSVAFIFTLPARTKQASSLRTLPASVVCSSVPAKPEAFLAEVTLRFTSAKNRCGLRADRLRPPSCPPLYPDTAPSSRCRALWSAPMVTNYLGKPPETSACYFRLVVAAALLSFLRSAQTVAFLVPPTHRGYAANITSSRHGYSYSPSATLRPPQAPMHGAPMH